MNMPENLYLEFDAFLRSIKQNLDGSFGVLLGAGASISSGIQSANDCIWDWKFLIYQSLSGNQKKLVDPQKSDLSAYSGGYPFSISGDIRSVPS